MIPKSKPVENKDFMLVEDPEDPKQFAVKILDGPLQGVVYKYLSVKITEMPDQAKLTFTRQVIEDPAKAIVSEEEMDQICADILHTVLTQMSAEAPENVIYKEEDGTSDRDPYTEEPRQERRVHEEGDPVSRE